MRDGKLVAGQIGCGGFAFDQDIPNLKERDDIVVKYCCDVSQELARAAAAQFDGAQAVTDFCLLTASLSLCLASSGTATVLSL